MYKQCGKVHKTEQWPTSPSSPTSPNLSNLSPSLHPPAPAPSQMAWCRVDFDLGPLWLSLPILGLYSLLTYSKCVNFDCHWVQQLVLTSPVNREWSLKIYSWYKHFPFFSHHYCHCLGHCHSYFRKCRDGWWHHCVSGLRAHLDSNNTI